MNRRQQIGGRNSPGALLLLAAVVLFFCAFAAIAQGGASPPAQWTPPPAKFRDWGTGNKWTGGQIARQVLLGGLIWADMQMTKDCLKSDPRCYEKNPWLGRNPSDKRLNWYGGIIFTGSTLLADQFDEGRDFFQWGLIGLFAYTDIEAWGRGWRPKAGIGLKFNL